LFPVSKLAGVALVLCALPFYAGAADVPSDLPEPLTLSYALSLIDDNHPDLVRARAGIDLAEAAQLGAEAETGVQSSIRAHALWVEPNRGATDRRNEDLAVTFVLSKPLYDFGRSRSWMTAEEASTRGQEIRYLIAMNRLQLEIASRYFDVMLADLQFTRDNEDMAVAYIALDKLRDRRELGTASDIGVLEQESRFQEIRHRRYASESRQRISRARLANAINRPGQLSANLLLPALPMLQRELPAVEALQDRASQNNPVLRALREELQAAHGRVAAARQGDNPVLTGEFGAGASSRELASRDELRVGVTLEVPLSRGGRTRAEVARYQALPARWPRSLPARKSISGRRCWKPGCVCMISVPSVTRRAAVPNTVNCTSIAVAHFMIWK
jgi:outer membrane protein TolC